jgi:Skp family chaperone for outer membrane proteins
MKIKHTFIWSLAAAGIAGIIAVGPLFADPATPASPVAAPAVKVGVVDVDAISKQYQELNKEQSDLQKWAADRQRYLDDLEKYMFLSQADFNEALTIIDLPIPRPEAKAGRLKELENLSADKEKRYLELRAKTNRDAKEGDEFNGLTDIGTARQQQIDGIKRKISEDGDKRLADARTALMAKVKDMIAQIAKEGGYTFIFDKAVVYSGGDDISQTVVDRLNKANPAPTPAPAPAPAPTPAPAPPASAPK